jgi:GT2 family glycosyltransferase
MSFTIEVIMAAYNNVQDMGLVLKGYLNQKDKDFSICIADDGSKNAVKALVDEYDKLGLNIRHIWQEDQGFRKAKIVNEAISTSKSKYIILTDNDCIPSTYFIEDYRDILSEGTIIIGRRVDMYTAASDDLRCGRVSLRKLESPSWLIINSLKNHLKRPEMGIRFPHFILKIWNKKERGAIGANMAVSRQALMEVNGFDNDYKGYGMEDTDLVWRLNKAGYTNKTMLGRCALFHLYHLEKEVGSSANTMFKQKKRSGLIKCINGITRL